MKRTITAAIAAATALSLAVVPAQAETPKKPELSASQQQGEKKESSSKISNEDAIKEALAGNKTKIVESIVNGKDAEADKAKALGPLASSFKSDKSNDWDFGTTFNILLGTGIAALLLVIFNFVKGGIKF